MQLFIDLSSSTWLSSAADIASSARSMKFIDFMSVVSSVLLLSENLSIETKVNYREITRLKVLTFVRIG